jgi:RNA polymerase sigma factor (sigma-70 family)
MDRPSFDAQFRGVFGEQFASLFRYLDRVSGDPDAAADAAQEAFVRLYRRGAMPEDVRVWLFTVATNLVRDQHRVTTRRRQLLERDAAEEATAGDGKTPESILAQGERRRQVRSALAALPLRDRRMLVLRHEGYSYREIAAVLGIAETSVGTLLARASEAFRSSFLRSHGAPE